MPNYVNYVTENDINKTVKLELVWENADTTQNINYARLYLPNVIENGVVKRPEFYYIQYVVNNKSTGQPASEVYTQMLYTGTWTVLQKTMFDVLITSEGSRDISTLYDYQRALKSIVPGETFIQNTFNTYCIYLDTGVKINTSGKTFNQQVMIPVKIYAAYRI